MRIPIEMPTRPLELSPNAAFRTADQQATIEPAGCCAQACVDTPFGRVCHCIAEAPFC
jgi:hypothetical protein